MIAVSGDVFFDDLAGRFVFDHVPVVESACAVGPEKRERHEKGEMADHFTVPASLDYYDT